MKKKNKKKLCTIFLVILGIVLFIKYISSIHFMYKINWNLNIPEPVSVDIIHNYTTFQGGDYLHIMHYKKKNIEKLIKKNHFKKINNENKEFLINKYNDFIDYYEKYNKELFDITIQPKITFKETNYYMLIEKGYIGHIDYSFLLLIIDINTNCVYAIDYYD